MKIQVAVAAMAVGAITLRADTAIQLSLTPKIALYPRTEMVRGLSLSIWGENPQVGLAIGLVNGSTGDSGGVSWGIVNYAESYEGLQWGAINLSWENFEGWQNGYINIAEGSFTGFQSGLINVCENSATGFQLGALNYAQELNGLQIGFVNLSMNNPLFSEMPDKLAPVFPVLNWSF
jgi:hypothetical protein